MHKIPCPRCGVVNLEKFVTFPQCAGCGSTLPQAKATVPLWKRPLKSWLWVSLIGGVLVGCVLVAANYLQVPLETNKNLIFYGVAARRGTVGDVITLTFTVDAATGTRVRRNAPLNNVKLRLPLAVFSDLRFISISPQPDEMTISGSSRYFHYATLPRDSNISLRLRAVRAGKQRFRVNLFAEDYLPADWRVSVSVDPQISQSKSPARLAR